MIEEERILCWNCHGASSSQFQREMRELRRIYKTLVLILLEPKVSGEVADGVCRDHGMNCWSLYEAKAFRGDVWVLWNEGEIMYLLGTHTCSSSIWQ